MVWRAHGCPRVPACVDVEGPCYVCGSLLGRGTPLKAWMGSNYVDQARVMCPLSGHVCEACAYVHSRTSPVKGREPKEGKKLGGNFRNYSHLGEGEWYANASKGEKPVIRDFLRAEHRAPWFAAIADSGQKHVLPFAPLNGPGRGGRVQFEDATVLVPEDTTLIDDVTEALTSGVTKDEILAGSYRVWTWQTLPDLVRDFESRRGGERGSEWFGLAVWLSQREEQEHARRQEARESSRRCGGRTEGRVPRGAKRAPPVELLGEDRASDESSGSDDGLVQRVVQRDAEEPAGRQPAQLGLFGIG